MTSQSASVAAPSQELVANVQAASAGRVTTVAAATVMVIAATVLTGRGGPA